MISNYITNFFQAPYLDTLLNVIQISIAALLITAILLQQRGTGLGAVFGGEGNIYFKKRGMEKIIFIASIVLAVLFLGFSFLNFLI